MRKHAKENIMKKFGKVLKVTALAVSLGRTAQAATLFTGLGDFNLDNGKFCQAVNTRTSPIDITIEALDQSGTTWFTKHVTLAPLAGTSLSGTSGKIFRCKFTVPSKRSVSAMMVETDSITGRYKTVIPAE